MSVGNPDLGGYLDPHVCGLTMSIPVVGMGDTSEPLLTSRVPDLWQQALVILTNLSLVLQPQTRTPVTSPAASPSCHPHPELYSETEPASTSKEDRHPLVEAGKAVM